MRLYDIVVVYKPELSDDDAQKGVEEIRQAVAASGGKIAKDETWGRRKLAYQIAKKREGIYHYVQAASEPRTIAEIGRRLKLSENVLRHLIVRCDDEMKRAEKFAARRAAKAARRPAKPRSTATSEGESGASEAEA